MSNSWDDKYNMSIDHIDEDVFILRSYFPDAVEIIKTSEDMDKAGVDYIVRYGYSDNYNDIYVDAKTRTLESCQRYFKQDQLGNLIPEFALEICSVTKYMDYVFDPKREDKVGWTLDSNNPVDYILYTYPDNCVHTSFLVPFQQLRRTFRSNYKKWVNQCGICYQKSEGYYETWYSACTFVNAYEVLDAMYSEIMKK